MRTNTVTRPRVGEIVDMSRKITAVMPSAPLCSPVRDNPCSSSGTHHCDESPAGSLAQLIPDHECSDTNY